MLYGSFLIRCWLPSESELASPAGGTFFVEHVQTGERFRTHSLEDAMAWIRQAALKLHPTFEPED